MHLFLKWIHGSKISFPSAISSDLGTWNGGNKGPTLRLILRCLHEFFFFFKYLLTLRIHKITLNNLIIWSLLTSQSKILLTLLNNLIEILKNLNCLIGRGKKLNVFFFFVVHHIIMVKGFAFEGKNINSCITLCHTKGINTFSIQNKAKWKEILLYEA